ncbi:DJ-1/PfpI family protein [Nocardia terrae]|uniref:DJ-1/PfpI family protein n=1 Tax=Nocardia terrae TaxID=2675851 RepID=UPI002E26365C
MTDARRVVFVVFDGVTMLDAAGPAEVFAEAGKFGADYALEYVSPSGAPVLTSVGIRLPVDGAAADVREPDTVIVTGGDVLVGAPVPGAGNPSSPRPWISGRRAHRSSGPSST